jgi:hypothetical protein
MTDYLALAKRSIKASETDRWKACLISGVMVGKHTSFARDLAELTGYEVSQISNFADAGKAWMSLCPYMRAYDRDKLSIGIFTEAWHVIEAGNEPYQVAVFLGDILEEMEISKRPSDRQIKEWMRGTFNMPINEPSAETHLRRFDALVSWGASKVMDADRKEWDRATTTIRRILRNNSQRS